MVTTITISDKLWNYINKERINPRETMEDVIWRFILLHDESNKLNKEYHSNQKIINPDPSVQEFDTKLNQKEKSI